MVRRRVGKKPNTSFYPKMEIAKPEERPSDSPHITYIASSEYGTCKLLWQNKMVLMKHLLSSIRVPVGDDCTVGKPRLAVNGVPVFRRRPNRSGLYRKSEWKNLGI